MPTLDAILNWVIPPLAILFFIWVFYKSLQGPFGGLGHGIRNLIEKLRGTREEYVSPIQYE